MPSLQLHQLRVGAVAKIVADAYPDEIATYDIIVAALFHDMGNIIKFNLELFPEFLEPEGMEYWGSVKKEYIEKYGTSSHKASVAIAHEIGLSDTVVELIDHISVSHLPEILEKGSVEQKIVEYADDRVGPFGVISVRERFADMARRYAGRYDTPDEALAQYAKYTDVASRIEEDLLAKTNLAPTDINDAAVAPLVEELKHFQVG